MLLVYLFFEVFQLGFGALFEAFWLLCSNYLIGVLTTTNWKLEHTWELELRYTI